MRCFFSDGSAKTSNTYVVVFKLLLKFFCSSSVPAPCHYHIYLYSPELIPHDLRFESAVSYPHTGLGSVCDAFRRGSLKHRSSPQKHRKHRDKTSKTLHYVRGCFKHVQKICTRQDHALATEQGHCRSDSSAKALLSGRLKFCPLLHRSRL
jgi:hypothetical protein